MATMILVVVLFAAILGWLYDQWRDDVQVATADVPNSCDVLVTVTTPRGRVSQYRGSCTVWRSYPQGKRCSSHMESWLCDIWRRHEWDDVAA